MASSPTAVLKQVIRSVAKADPPAVTDKELLRRFVGNEDQQAFAALVGRHTGMVLGVCRRVLPTVQDAEDACQAAFLLLARKANSVRWQTSVANWLYVTARQVAHNARVAAQRRAKREARAAVLKAVQPVDRMTGRELLETLDVELERLPPRYREPLVLCYLEGLTRDEAALQLGVPVKTLHTRIDRGRKKLHDALTKGGCALGAGLLALAITSPARASPPRLVKSILATVSGSVPDAVAELAKGVAVNGVIKKALVILALVGVVALGLGLGAMSPIAAKAQKPAPRADAKTEKPRPEGKDRTFTGTVLAADGKPVVADLSVNWIEGKLESFGKTKEDGTFRVTVPVKGQGGWLVATAAGHGMDFVSVRAEPPAEIALRLPKEQPISGRIIDPQGKPLADVRVTVDGLTCYDNDSLDKHMKQWTNEFFMHGIPPGGDRSLWFRSDNPADRESESPISVKTDADGKFEVAGVGADQQVGLTLRGAGVALTRVSVMNRTGFDPKPHLEAANESAKMVPARQGRWGHLYGPAPQIIAEREKTFRGRVTARDTGKPLAGVPVVARLNQRFASPVAYEAVTDKDGQYEVRGVRKHQGYFVECRTDPSTGYFTNQVEVGDTAGYEPVTVNLECAKGVIVTGTLKDKTTGKPISVRVWREEIPGNPFAKNYPAYNLKGEVTSQGSFRFVTIPGPVLLMALIYKGKDGQIYQRAKPDPKYPNHFPDFADAVWCRVIDTKETDREVHVEIELEPAPRMTVKVVDADGQPVTGSHATGVTHKDFARPVHHPDTDTLTVFNVEPKQERLLAVAHAKRRLVGTRVVKDGDKDPVVKLGPGGVILGRMVDANGKPIGGLTVDLHYTRREVSEASEPLNADNMPAMRVGRREVVTDANGEFRIDALFPEQEFRLMFQKAKKRFGPDYNKAPLHKIEKHGDTLKLGDVKVEPNENDGED